MTEKEIINGIEYMKKVLVTDLKEYCMVQDPAVKLYEKILNSNHGSIRVAYSKKNDLESYFLQNTSYNIHIHKKNEENPLNIKVYSDYNNLGLSKILYEVNKELFKISNIH